MAGTFYARGSGGIVFEFDEPAPGSPRADWFAYKFAKGDLIRCDADGSTGVDEPVEEPGDTGDLDPTAPARPVINAPKNEWVGYAVSQGLSVDEADAMTKADLIERFGK